MSGRASKAARDTIVSMAAEGYTHTEIAKKVGVSMPTVRKYAGPARAWSPPKKPADRADIDDLKQRIEELEEIVAKLMPLANAPKTCPQGHELASVIRCLHRDCRIHGEWFIHLQGSKPWGPLKFGRLHMIQHTAYLEGLFDDE